MRKVHAVISTPISNKMGQMSPAWVDFFSKAEKILNFISTDGVFSIKLLTIDPVPVPGNILLYAITDGHASPNNTITFKALLPNGTSSILLQMII